MNSWWASEEIRRSLPKSFSGINVFIPEALNMGDNLGNMKFVGQEFSLKTLCFHCFSSVM